jgi:hypothetical protein
MKIGSRLPSPALIVALVALLVALSGVSYAAVQLGKGTVSTKSLKNKSVTKKKLAPEVRGAAVAWADVSDSGSVTAGRGITASNINRSGGFYCFRNLPPHGTASVTPAFTGDEFGSFAIATVSKAATQFPCLTQGTQFGVATQFFNVGADDAPFSPEGFTIVLHK